jgi:chorismate mutase
MNGRPPTTDDMQSIRAEIDEIDRTIVDLLARRLDRAMAMGRAKAAAGIALHAPLRERQVIEAAAARARESDVDERYVRLLYRLVVEHSRSAQRRAAESWAPAGTAVAG